MRLPWSLAINPRAELRRGLFAAAESCWVYAALAVAGGVAGVPRLLSPFSIWLTYWAGLEIGRYLPRLRRSWRALQVLNLVLALSVFLVVMRLDLYADWPWNDFAWLADLLRSMLTLSSGLTPVQLALVPLVYAYLRGVGYGQRPLTLWFVGFQFRLGVLLLFLISVIAVWTRPVDLSRPIILYFVISLVNIALARVQEAGQERGLNARWAVLLLVASLAVVVVGLVATPVLTLAGADLVFRLLSPVIPVLVFALSLILVPLAWVIGLAFELIAPLLRGLSENMRHLTPQISLPESVSQATSQVLAQFTGLLPYLRLAALLAVIFGVAVWVARALNRRMMQDEQETYVREAADIQHSGIPDKPFRVPSLRQRAREIQAENIRRVYAALQARAAALGLPRREAETPLEFLPRLVARFPQGAADLREITDAYIAVHYGEQDVSAARVRAVRAVWQRLASQMRKEGTRIHAD